MPAKPESHSNTELICKRGRPNLYPFYIGIFAVFLLTGLVCYFYFRRLPVDAGQNSKSYALLGHRAFREMLERCGYHILLNRRQLPQQTDLPCIFYLAPEESLAENFLPHSLYEEIEIPLRQGATVCYACTKWYTEEDRGHPGWIVRRIPLETEIIEERLKNFDPDIRLRRLAADQIGIQFKDGSLQGKVVVDRPQVFSQTGKAKVLVDGSEGPLVISLPKDRGQLILVADADIFTNYALPKGDNSAVALRLAEICSRDRKVVVDEVAHGFGQDLKILEILFSFPGICVTGHTAIFGLFFILTALRPFTKIQKEPKLERSREEQVKTTAYLTYTTGGHRSLLRNYFSGVLKEMQEYYPALKGLALSDQIAYLDAIAGEKEAIPKLLYIYQRLQVAQTQKKIYHVFEELYTWKERMIYGHHS